MKLTMGEMMVYRVRAGSRYPLSKRVIYGTKQAPGSICQQILNDRALESSHHESHCPQRTEAGGLGSHSRGDIGQ